MPKLQQIKINGKKYQLLPLEDDPHKEPNLCGKVDSHNSLIYLDYTLDKQQLNETILHEAIHVISDDFGLNLSENKVKTLAVSIYSLIVNNKSFANSITNS